MNREIKFRIYADNKFYNKCLVGNTNNVNDEKWTCPMVWLEKQKEWVHCDNGIICQYTGIKDKNGKEIYEGDIVKLDSNTLKITGIVTYHNDEAVFVLEDLHDEIEECLWYMQEDLEVIGNIYDNPELLRGE